MKKKVESKEEAEKKINNVDNSHEIFISIRLVALD